MVLVTLFLTFSYLNLSWFVFISHVSFLPSCFTLKVSLALVLLPAFVLFPPLCMSGCFVAFLCPLLVVLFCTFGVCLSWLPSVLILSYISSTFLLYVMFHFIFLLWSLHVFPVPAWTSSHSPNTCILN